MALRIVLLGVVIGMGAELPSAQRFEAWAQRGQTMVTSLWAEFQHLRNGTEADTDAVRADARLAQTRTDQAFGEVMDAIASDFSRDLDLIAKATPAPPASTDSPALASTSDIAEMDADGLDAFAPIPAVVASSEPAGDPLASVDDPADDSASTETEVAADDVSSEPRLNSAVRLTRAALGAWLEVLSTSSATR